MDWRSNRLNWREIIDNNFLLQVYSIFVFLLFTLGKYSIYLEFDSREIFKTQHFEQSPLSLLFLMIWTHLFLVFGFNLKLFWRLKKSLPHPFLCKCPFPFLGMSPPCLQKWTKSVCLPTKPLGQWCQTAAGWIKGHSLFKLLNHQLLPHTVLF